jgi:hypothetical protein
MFGNILVHALDRNAASVRRTQIKSGMTQFSLPRAGEIYTNQVFDRCESLIEAKLWDGLNLDSLRGWLKNFTNDVEKYFAACLLD